MMSGRGLRSSQYLHRGGNWVIVSSMNASDLFTVDPEILGGTPVFKNTRVPIKTLFDYLENNYTLEEFLECFPSVTREAARGVLETSERALLAR
jgi:uncharacterized protein (DUF433 family)